MRSTTETIQLDQSLRQSRTIYVTLSIVFLPIALGGLTFGLSAIRESIRMLSGGYTASDLAGQALMIVLGVVFISVEYVVISQTIEANRRLRILREYPNQKVRKLPAPFQSSLFGPYH